MQLLKPTSLENTSDVKDTLQWKLKDIESNKLPAESALADYLALAIENLEKKLEYVLYSKSIFDNEAKDIKKQIDFIKVESACFLRDQGIEKLIGVRCSSVSMTKERLASSNDVDEKVFYTSMSNIEIQEFLIDLGKAEMKTVTKTEKIDFIPAKMKINKKKVKK